MDATQLYVPQGYGSPQYIRDPHSLLSLLLCFKKNPVVGTPREQFEEGLTVIEWHACMDVRGQYNM